MPQPLFDVYFRGALLPDADPAQVRDRLAGAFGLGGAELERLFGGNPVCVKRGVDVDSAAQLRGRFRDAGALVDIRPAETARAEPPAASPAPAPAPAVTEAAGDGSWTLAPAGAPVSDATPPPAIDTSHLSMAAPNTGSLEDCRQELPARPIGDISHLSLSDD
jgi:hypothetical protein